MAWVHGTAILALGLVFALAAIAKLLDREGTRQGLIGFGVPIPLAGPGSRILPLVEAGVALAILVPLTTRAGAALAALLLVAFTALVAYHLAAGRKPGCRCFGALGDDAIGPRTLARNALLLGLAMGVAGWGDGSGLATLAGQAAGAGWPGALAMLNLALLGGIAWVGLGVWQQQGRLLARLAELEAHGTPTAVEPKPHRGLTPGSFAPDFKLAALAGGQRTLSDLLDADRSTLLLFFDTACAPCDGMLRRVAEWQMSHRSKLRVLPVFSGEEDAVRARAKIHRLEEVMLQRDFEVGDAFGVVGTPGAVLLNPEGRLQGPVLAGAESIARLVEAVVVVQEAPAEPATSAARPSLREPASGAAGSAPARPVARTLLSDASPALQGG